MSRELFIMKFVQIKPYLNRQFRVLVPARICSPMSVVVAQVQVDQTAKVDTKKLKAHLAFRLPLPGILFRLPSCGRW
jgi:hypothetical protein